MVEQHTTPDLAELERRIEQLAQDLEKAYAHQTCDKCREQLAEKSSNSPPLPRLNRPSPVKDRVSFYACTPSRIPR